MQETAWILLLDHASSVWAAAMLRACVQGGLCVVLVWAVCRLWPRLPASGRAWLWWLACLKLTASLLCVAPVVLPVLPHTVLSPALPQVISTAPNSGGAGMGGAIRGMARHAPADPLSGAEGLPAPPELGAGRTLILQLSPLTFLWLLWLMGLGVTLGASLRRWQTLRRRVGRLRPAGDAGIIETEAVSGPLVLGLRRPVILLPRTPLSPEERAMALAHERAHLRRGDLWLGQTPALTQSLFFFFPPARWAAHEYHLAREEACDADALRETGAAPAHYARLLLRFASLTDPAPALGLTSGFLALRRRLTLLPQAGRALSPRARRAAALGLALALPGVLPWQLTAAAGRVPKAVSLPDPRTLRFVLTDLGTTDGNGTGATGLNDRAQVVGSADTTPPSVYGQALLWNGDRAQALPALPGDVYCRASGINDAGQVIASSYSAYDQNQAFVWQAGRRTPLGGLPGFPHSKALGLNAAGQVAGYVQTGDYDAKRERVAHAALWDADGRPMDLGTLGGDYSAAYGVNDHGQVVGKADTAYFGSTHAFLWQEGRMTDLGTLGGPNSLAVRVSDTGQIVGYSETFDGTHACVWQNGTVRDLGTLPGVNDSEAHGVNDRGQIVGESGGTAALWQDGRIADLSRLVKNAPGWALQDAVAVNVHGQIAGRGLAPDGRLHAFLLTPI